MKMYCLLKRPCLFTKISNTQLRSFPGNRNQNILSDEERQYLRDSIEKDVRSLENLRMHVDDYYDELDASGEDYFSEGTMQDTIRLTQDEVDNYIETIHIKQCFLEGSETGPGFYDAWDWIRADLIRENLNGELTGLLDHVSEVLQTQFAQQDFERQWANYEHIYPFLNIFSQSNENPDQSSEQSVEENVEDQTQVSQPPLTDDAPNLSSDLSRSYNETQDNHSGVEAVQESTGLAENNTSQNQTAASESSPVNVSPSNNSSVDETQGTQNIPSEQAAQENVEDQTQVSQSPLTDDALDLSDDLSRLYDETQGTQNVPSGQAAQENVEDQTQASQPPLTADAPNLSPEFNNLFDPNSHSNESNGNNGSLLDDFADTSCEPGDFMGGDD